MDKVTLWILIDVQLELKAALAQIPAQRFSRKATTMTRSISLNLNEKSAISIRDIWDLWSTRPARKRHPDVRELPDHLKRDLGILDGSRPVGGIRW